jgi:hypothetical protein
MTTSMKAAPWLALVISVFFFLLTSIDISSRRLLWFDEINTLRIVNLPSTSEVLRVQNSLRADSAPISYYFLLRLLHPLNGRKENTPRLLSALAMAAALIVIYDAARRIAGWRSGMIALSVAGSSFLTYYGFEGRSYALVVLFTSIVLWLYLFTRDAWASAICLGAGVFCAVQMHFTSVLALVPFGLWELSQWRPWKAPSKKLLVGCAGVIGAVCVSLEQIRNASKWSGGYWCPPSLAALAQVWAEIFPLGLFTLAVVALLLCLRPLPKASFMDKGERVCWFFVSIPFAGFILAKVATNAFYHRYLISVLPGIAIAFACIAVRNLGRPAQYVLLLALCGAGALRQMNRVREAELIEPFPPAEHQQAHTREAMQLEERIRMDGKTTILTDTLLVDQMQYYSKHPELYAMYQPDDVALECEYFKPVCLGTAAAADRASDMAALYPTGKLINDMRNAGFEPQIRLMDSPEPTLVYFSRAGTAIAPH